MTGRKKTGVIFLKKCFFESFHSNMRVQLIKECTKYINKGLKAIYILPSREAMFDVRELFIKELGGLFDCYIFGFDNFEKLILKDMNLQENLLNDHETAIIFRTLLARSKPESIFYSVKGKPGFISGLQTVIRKLKRLDISPDAFLDKTKCLAGITGTKCKNLYEVFNEYEKYKRDKKLYDIDDLSIMAVEYIQNAEILKQTGVIIIDGFINIDPINVKLLKTITNNISNIDVFSNIPFKNDNNLDFLQEEVIKDFNSLGTVMVDDKESHKLSVNSCLKDISQKLYSGGGEIELKENCITFSESPCLDHEIRETARSIKKLLIEDKVKPHEIAIFCSNPEEYKNKVRDIFNEYGVPIHINSTEKLISIPLIKDLLCLFKHNIKEYAENSFLTIVSSKYLLPEEVLQKTGFESDGFFKIAERIAKRYPTEQYFSAFREALVKESKAEDVSEEMEQYLETVEQFSPENSGNPIEALKRFKDIINILKIEDQIKRLHESGTLSTEAWLRDVTALQKINGIIVELIAAYSRLEVPASASWFDRLQRDLQQIVMAVDIGITGRDTGGVKFLPPDRARGQDYDTVFILGLNEGAFPSTKNGCIVFDGIETTELNKLGINLGESVWELQREKLRFNACIAAARNRLYISYRSADEDGGLMIPSPFLEEIITVFAKDSIEKAKKQAVSMRQRMRYEIIPTSQHEALRKLNARLWTKQRTEKYDSGIIAQTKMTIGELLKYSGHAAGMELSRELNPFFDQFDGKLLNPKLAQQDADYGFSASQLNSYARCPFQYFTERVLGMTDDEEEPLGAKSIGTLYHAVLKAYYEGNEMPEEVDSERLKITFEKMESEIDYGNLPKALMNFIRDEIFNVLNSFVKLDSENLKRYQQVTGFRLKPEMLEQPFKIHIGKEGNLLRGITDRVDLEIDKAGNYTRRYIIFDYKKSGIKGLKECIEGKDFQLPLYIPGIEALIKEKYSVEKPECLALLYYSIEKLEWKGIIRSDIKSALFDSKKRPQVIAAQNMKALMEWIEGEVEKTIGYIRKGAFMIPKECPAGFFDCRYKRMCRYDKFRLECKS